MESLLNSFGWLRVATACYTGAYPPLHHFLAILAFSTTIHSRFTAFRVTPFQLGFQSHRVFSFTTFRVVFLILTFIVIISVHSRCFCLAFMLLFLVWRSKPPFLRSLVFGAMFVVRHSGSLYNFQFWRSKPSLLHFWFWHLKPSLSLFSFGIQSHHHHIFSFGIQNHHHCFLVSAFKAIIALLV